jgi:hypothetical protein
VSDTKSCPSCGEEVKSVAQKCKHCGEWFDGRPREEEQSYDQIPWFRKSSINSVFVLVGFFCFPPLLLATCVILLTGDVYYDKRTPEGGFKTWSAANKVVAVILLVLQIVGFAVRLGNL